MQKIHSREMNLRLCKVNVSHQEISSQKRFFVAGKMAKRDDKYQKNKIDKKISQQMHFTDKEVHKATAHKKSSSAK